MESILFSHGNCQNCARKIYKPLKKARKVTGELDLFREIFTERGGRCEITGEKLVFDPWCFAHILGKKAYPKFRLLKENIAMVKADLHTLYDNGSQEKLLEKYPGAIEIYHRKESLKTLYHNHDGHHSDSTIEDQEFGEAEEP